MKWDVLVVVVGEGEVVVGGEHPGQPAEEGNEEQHQRSHSLRLLRSVMISFALLLYFSFEIQQYFSDWKYIICGEQLVKAGLTAKRAILQSARKL